jgi:hypothetical protein
MFGCGYAALCPFVDAVRCVAKHDAHTRADAMCHCNDIPRNSAKSNEGGDNGVPSDSLPVPFDPTALFFLPVSASPRLWKDALEMTGSVGESVSQSDTEKRDDDEQETKHQDEPPIFNRHEMAREHRRRRSSDGGL